MAGRAGVLEAEQGERSCGRVPGSECALQGDRSGEECGAPGVGLREAQGRSGIAY